jgi:UDP-glucose:(heptosyl)LPS alpha-1,3-glucosyltransferase
VRIAFIRQRYNPFGGAERFIERAMDALADEGTKIAIVAREWPSAAGRDAYRYIRCDPAHRGRLSRDLTFAAEACGVIEREAFDLVQSHERLPCCDVYRAGDGVHAQWLAQRARAQGVFARAATAWSVYHRYVLAAERRVFQSLRLRAVVCNSQMVREDIVRHYGVDQAKLHVVYNGVDLEHFHPRLRETFRASSRAQLGIGADDYVYLFVGSGFERKGVDRLLRAFSALREDRARVVVVGEDRALARSRALAERLGVAARVTFTGGQKDVRPYYGAADAFVLPTLYDPFPNAALEALACGVPVITTFQCGAAELIDDGVNGGVCDALDQGRLVEVLRETMAADSAGLRSRARTSVEHLGIDAMAKRLLSLYRDVIAAKSKPN